MVEQGMYREQKTATLGGLTTQFRKPFKHVTLLKAHFLIHLFHQPTSENLLSTCSETEPFRSERYNCYPESILIHSFNSPVLFGMPIPKSW